PPSTDLVPVKYHLCTFVSNSVHVFPSTYRGQAEKRRSETVSSLPQKPTAHLMSIKSLLEKHNPREAYEILAAQIILANERTRDAPPSRVQTAESHRIKITENKLQEIRTGRFGRVQLPSEEEARYWLQQWCEGAKHKEEPPI